MGIGWDSIKDWVEDYPITKGLLIVVAILLFLKGAFGWVLPFGVEPFIPYAVLITFGYEFFGQWRKRRREKARVASELSNAVQDFRTLSSQQFVALHRGHSPINYNGQLLSGVQALGAHGFQFTLQEPAWGELERRAEAVGLDPEPLRQVHLQSDALFRVIKRAIGGQWINILTEFGQAQTAVNTAGNECHRAYDGIAAKIRGEKDLPSRIA